MLQLSGRIGLGMNVGNFLEFERAFHRYGVVNPAAEKQCVLFIGEATRQRLDPVVVLKHGFCGVSHLSQRCCDLRFGNRIGSVMAG